MKEFTGEKLVRGAKAVAALKGYFHYNKELYDGLFAGMTLTKYVKNDDSSSDLVYEGDVDGEHLTLTVHMNKKLRIAWYDSKFDNGKHLRIEAKDGESGSCGYYESEEWREFPYYWNVECIEMEMGLWIHSVNKDFKDCPIRLRDWRRLNPEQYSIFDAAAKKAIETESIKTLRYDPIIKHFTKESWDTCNVSALVGIEGNGKPFIGIWIHYTPSDTKDDFSRRVIYNGEAESIEQYCRYDKFWGKKFYNVADIPKFFEEAQSRVDAEQDKIAKEHGIEWRGIEFDGHGPVKDRSAQKKFEAEIIPKILDTIKESTFDFEKFFTPEEIVKTFTEDSVCNPLGARYEKTMTFQKKKGKKYVPFEAKIVCRPHMNFHIYGYDKFVLEGDTSEKYDVGVDFEFPFMYRTIDGKYLTFDEAMEHSDGGPIDIHWRPVSTTFSHLVDERRDRDDYDDDEIAKKINREYKGPYGEPFMKWCDEHYPDFFNRDGNYVLGILNNYQAQFEKYMAYVKEKESCSTSA